MILIENALVAAREYLAADTSEESAAVKQQIVEAEQVASGKIDGQQASGDTAMGGPGMTA